MKLMSARGPMAIQGEIFDGAQSAGEGMSEAHERSSGSSLGFGGAGGGGGGGGEGGEGLVLRENFVTTPLFLGSVMVDDTGETKIPWTLYAWQKL